MKFVLAAAFALVLSAAPLFGQSPKPGATKPDPAWQDALASHPGLIYARYGDRELALDLFRPKQTTAPLPAIICIHGGGWHSGDRKAMGNLAQALAMRGFVTVAISYRLSGEAIFPAAIQDAKAAVRWLRAEAGTYGIDPDHIGVAGLSAGGHLAALLTTSGGVAALEGDGGHPSESSAVHAGIAMGAQSDLENARIGELSSRPNDPFYRVFLGAPQSEAKDRYALASPRHHLSAGDPPLLFMTGELDDDSTHAAETRADLESLGIPTGLHIYPHAPHALLGQQAPFDAAVLDCEAFFVQHLQSKAPAKE